MFRGIGFQLCPVDRHVPQFHQARLTAQLQDLQEQRCNDLQVPFAEFRYRRMIRMLVGRNHPKRHRFVGLPLDPA